ncbi:MAG: phosphatase [Mycobacteriales bacterium]
MSGPSRERLLASGPSRERLLAHLVASRIAGDVATPRENNLRNISLLCERQEGWTFGLAFDRPWTPEEVFEVMVARVGIAPDPAHREGSDTIDPLRTLAKLEEMATMLADAASQRARVLVATGHPAGIYAIHARVAAALRAAGAHLVTAAAGCAYRTRAGAHREIRWLGGVGMVSNRGELNHTHSPRPMELVLAALSDAGEAPPDLVLADHGWAGAAGQAGIRTVGFADCNDPALFVGEAEGKVAACVPLDDNVLPHLYEPLGDFLLASLNDHR